MKKKLIGLLFLIAALVLSVAGCGTSKSSENKSSADANTLTVWGWDKNMNGYAIDQAKKVYEKKTGKSVKVKFVPQFSSQVQR